MGHRNMDGFERVKHADKPHVLYPAEPITGRSPLTVRYAAVHRVVPYGVRFQTGLLCGLALWHYGIDSCFVVENIRGGRFFVNLSELQ
jgi:hypothetical protein